MSDDRDWRQYTRRGALGLMGVGAGLAATETAGITSLTSDRSTTLRFADDSTAMLGIEGDDGSSYVGINDPTDDTTTSFTNSPVTIKFTNRLENAIPTNELKVTITNDKSSDLDGTLTDFTPDSGKFPISDGSSITILNDSEIGTSTSTTATFDLSTGADLNGIELEIVRAETTNNETILTGVTRTFDLDGS